MLFIIVFNGALLRPAIPRIHSLNLKYVDDLSMLSALNLKSSLVADPIDRLRPLNYNEKTCQVLARSNNQLQSDLLSPQEFASKKLMKIKEKKTQIMKFNFSKAHDFPPEFDIPGFHDELTVVRETKLLGVLVTKDLKQYVNPE